MNKKIASQIPVGSQNITNYNTFLDIIMKYEDLNQANYAEGNDKLLVFGNADFKKAVQMSIDLSNPCLNLYHWSKGELYDVEAIFSALSMKDKIE